MISWGSGCRGQSQFGVPSLNDTHIPSPSDVESAYADTSHRSSSPNQYFRDESCQRLDSNSLSAAGPSKQPRKSMSSADAVQRLSVLIQSLSKQLGTCSRLHLGVSPWSISCVLTRARRQPIRTPSERSFKAPPSLCKSSKPSLSRPLGFSHQTRSPPHCHHRGLTFTALAWQRI